MNAIDREKFRKEVYNKRATSLKQLRNLEKELVQTKIRNILLLRLWMKGKGFYDLDEDYVIQLVKLALIFFGKADLATKISINRLIGDPEHSDFQQFKSYGKQFGKMRWHWRVYHYTDRIIVISELENDPIGNQKDIYKSIQRHLREDVLKPQYDLKKGPKKHSIVLLK